ncbi:helix-turn-helix domain-containing protein [Nonomuraea sp. NPDC049419]|uniref:AraC-like ligand-binding domain-containing protein n=1 Tax=Nonomuraea sp. NPDC049419 TaxID=3155772 RepID=UPI00344A645C
MSRDAETATVLRLGAMMPAARGTHATVVRLDTVPVRERFDFWWQTVSESVVSVDASSDRAADYWAEMHLIDLGRLQLSRVRCHGFHARRTASRIRRSDPETYQLSVTMSGRSVLRQEGRETPLASTDITIYDASRPFDAWNTPIGPSAPGARTGPRAPGAESGPVGPSAPGGDVSEGLILSVPRDMLALPHRHVRHLLARRIPGHDGLGSLLRGLLQGLTHAEHLSPADLTRLSGVTVDLLTAVLAHQIETNPAPNVADPAALLLLRIRAYIDRHLHQPDLSPAGIAAAHHISLRHMQRLFAQEGDTVGGWIRSRRLEHSRRALADPALATLPVNVIAARSGFTSEAHFNRLFRHVYGVPPATYRRQTARTSASRLTE